MSEHEAQDVTDELSAYLDGELDAASRRRVEERLGRDAGYQAQLQKLERTWDLLDRLPRAEVGEDFTKTTIEMVALSASQEAETVVDQMPRRRRQQKILGSLAMAAALLVGFFLGRGLWPDPNEPLLKDLPVLKSLDLYYQADDIEFLRELDKANLFAESEGEHAS